MLFGPNHILMQADMKVQSHRKNLKKKWLQ